MTTHQMSATELERRVSDLEAQLVEKETILKCLEESTDGIWDWNVLTGEDYLSERWKNMLGYEDDELPNRVETWQSLVEPDDLEVAYAAVQAHLEDDQPYEVVLRYRRKDGGVSWMYARGKAVRDSEGTFRRMIGTHTDLTPHKELEQALAAARADLSVRVDERTEELRVAVDDLEVSNRSLREFAHVAAHDLREPLRTITSFVKLLGEEYGETFDETGERYLGFVTDGVGQMQQLLDGILLYSQVGESIHREVCNLSSLLEQRIAELGALVVESQASIEVGPLPNLEVDPLLMGQVFQNLLSNAMKYRRPDAESKIWIDATREGDMWRIRFVDNGIGMDPTLADESFQLFRRLHPDGSQRGTGTGLAIVKRCVEAHGGSVAVETKEGIGSTFHLLFPV